MVVVCPFQVSQRPLRPLHEILLENFHLYPTEICVEDALDPEKRWTFSKVHQMALNAAQWLSDCGFEKGDIMAVYLENRPEFLPVFIAVSMLGGAFSGINPAYKAEELSRQVNDCGARFILSRKELLPNVMEAKADKGCKLQNVFVYDDKVSATPQPPCISLNQILFEKKIGKKPLVLPKINPQEDVILVPYSSGTTGLPKGVMLTHANMNYIFPNPNQSAMNPFQNIKPGDSIVLLLPFFHIAGFMGLCWALTNGATAVVLPRFEPHLYLETVARVRAPSLMLVPSVLVFLAKHPDVAKYDLTCVKRVGVGSAPSGKELMQALLQRLPGIECIDQGYGLTETGGLVTITPGIPIDRYPLGSCGVPSPGTEVKVVDVANNGVELGPMERGEIWCRSPANMKGYVNKPEATREIMDSEGWLHTGDIGYFDQFGHFYVVDRLKDLIKYKGFQVPPAELEDLLLKHETVQEVAVVGMTDPKDPYIGELPTAFVVLKQSWEQNDKQRLADELKALVEKHVAPYKQLRGGVFFLKTLPKGATGKLLRRTLRNQPTANLKGKL